MFFSTLPTVADGFQLKIWRGRPEAGKPKIPPSAKGLLERGLMQLDTCERLLRLFFTEAALAELRRMMADRRSADPDKFAHAFQDQATRAALEGSNRTKTRFAAGRVVDLIAVLWSSTSRVENAIDRPIPAMISYFARDVLRSARSRNRS